MLKLNDTIGLSLFLIDEAAQGLDTRAFGALDGTATANGMPRWTSGSVTQSRRRALSHVP